MRIKILLSILLVSFALVLGIASAQTKNGIVRGTVFDETRALIPGVTITLSNLEKNDVRKVVSNARGEYSFDTPAGSYELKAELPGFETLTVGPIPVKESETLRFDLTLKIARRDSLPRN